MASWYPGEYRPAPWYPPEYRSIREDQRLVVNDNIAPSLEGDRLLAWRKTRNRAFAQWSPVGINIRVRENNRVNRIGRVTLAFMTPEEDAESYDIDAWHQYNENGSDWIHFEPVAVEQAFLAHSYSHLRYLVAHEFGHSLGFGHGGTGIMDQTPYHAFVNAEEIAAAQAYWL